MSLKGSQAAAMLSQMTPEQLAMTPVAPPPPGIVPNFQDPANRLCDFLGVGIPFFVLATGMLGIRIHMKAFVLHKWRIGDTSLVIGYLITLIWYILMCYGTAYVNVGHHIYELHLSTMYGPQGFWIGLWASSIPQQIAFAFIKSSLFLQYYHLFKTTRWLRYCILGGLVVNVLFYASAAITLIVVQSPWPGETTFQAPFADRSVTSKNLFLPTGILGVLLDWYLLLLPIPAVLNLKLSGSKKIGVLTIFMTGILASTASIVSLYYRTTLPTINKDPTWSMVTVLAWILVELLCGIIACCMPTLHLFWTRYNSLVQFGARFRTGMKEMMHISDCSVSDFSYTKPIDKPRPAHLRAPPGTLATQQYTNNDEILIIQGFSVDHSTLVGHESEMSFELEDTEAQKRRSKPW